jgi:hypothetical protein
VAIPLTGVANNKYWDLIRLSGSSAAIRSWNGAVPALAQQTELWWLTIMGQIGQMKKVQRTAIFPDCNSGTATSQVETSFSPFTFGLDPGSLFLSSWNISMLKKEVI